jgi:hypothetical protein
VPADENNIVPMRSSGSKTDRHGIRPSESASTLSVVVAKFILPGLVVITVGTMIRESIFLQSKILEPMMGKEDVFYANVDASNLIRSSSNSSSSTSSSTSTSMISASPAKVPVPTAHMQGEEKPQNTLNSNANANATITILPDNKTTSKHTNSSGTSMKSASPTKAPVRTAHMQGEEQPQKSLNSNATSTITAIPPTNPTKGKRTLYLHIGPLKTGTTTIQAIMRENKIKNAAKLDGIALRPAETFERKIDSCFTKTKTEYKNCKTILQAYFDSQDADTVFLSHELLGNTAMTGNYWSMLMSVLEDNWHIRIVLGYRRYYAWKTSMANQIFKLYWNVPPDKESDFVEDALSVQKLFSSKKFEWERPFTKFQFYKNQGPGVFGVINLHDPSHMQNHLAERVFCEIVETAPNLCKAVRSYVASKKNKSGSKKTRLKPWPANRSPSRPSTQVWCRWRTARNTNAMCKG